MVREAAHRTLLNATSPVGHTACEAYVCDLCLCWQGFLDRCLAFTLSSCLYVRHAATPSRRGGWSHWGRASCCKSPPSAGGIWAVRPLGTAAASGHGARTHAPRRRLRRVDRDRVPLGGVADLRCLARLGCSARHPVPRADSRARAAWVRARRRATYYYGRQRAPPVSFASANPEGGDHRSPHFTGPLHRRRGRHAGRRRCGRRRRVRSAGGSDRHAAAGTRLAARGHLRDVAHSRRRPRRDLHASSSKRCGRDSWRTHAPPPGRRWGAPPRSSGARCRPTSARS